MGLRKVVVWPKIDVFSLFVWTSLGNFWISHLINCKLGCSILASARRLGLILVQFRKRKGRIQNWHLISASAHPVVVTGCVIACWWNNPLKIAINTSHNQWDSKLHIPRGWVSCQKEANNYLRDCSRFHMWKCRGRSESLIKRSLWCQRWVQGICFAESSVYSRNEVCSTLVTNKQK